MAEFTKVMRDASRMCKSFVDCKNCPVDEKYECPIDIPNSHVGGLKKVESKIEQWAESHPENTNLDAIKKVFPKANSDYDHSCLMHVFGAVKDCNECEEKYKSLNCRTIIKKFLDAPYEEPEESNGNEM